MTRRLGLEGLIDSLGGLVAIAVARHPDRPFRGDVGSTRPDTVGRQGVGGRTADDQGGEDAGNDTVTEPVGHCFPLLEALMGATRR